MKKHLLVVIALIALVGFAGSVYSQAAKRVLMENLTSSTCPPCASNNPQLYNWQQSHWNQGLVMIAYHMNWPSPGNDPMYAFNPTQNTERRTYYGVNSIPYGILMGIHTYIGSPFPWANLDVYFNLYNGQATPTSIDLTDTRISNNDSNRCNITVINLSTLPGNYNMKVYVVET
jgi:thiol-disulfide isomerase/thioredoxin